MGIENVRDLGEYQKQKTIQEFLARTGTIQRPPCWKCKGKVPAMEVDLNTKLDCITITAKCHGEKETLFIPTKKIKNIAKIEIGWAFQPSSGRQLEKA